MSAKAASFTESVIREMTRLAARHSALNLAQGFPNFAAPQEIKDAACHAIQQDINQYAVTWGAPRFRRALAEKYRRFYDWDIDPDRHITVACGATECMIAAILAVVDPGQKVLIIEPFYENYGPDTILAGSTPVYLSLDPQRGWSLDFEEMESVLRREAAEGEGVRALILNTPHNPTGKVFSRHELERIAQLACEYDFYVLTDEIYEHIVYDGHEHLPIALMDGMAQRTITISGMSKSYSVTGWRVGTIIAPQDLSGAIRKVHDFLTVGAAAPLQEAGVAAMNLPDSYYQQLATDYRERRDYLLPALRQAGFRFEVPEGAYYVMTDISGLSDLEDVAFVRRMITEFQLAAVPGSSFFHDKSQGRRYVRFAFCKTLDLLEEASRRIAKIGASG
ncbi:MAG TPA: aminotransferase class I/II-fold pyridoxal phosphate-dependent enzyme [Acidobacteriota bacterium]|nr:aminotransferase class I/II-fold pyridoxal phosphate-dependent enzyme [Acidobacteriota bacterium]